MWRSLGVWCLLLLAGATALLGRYDFSEANGQFARQAYLSTLYYLLIVPPLVYALASRAGTRPRFAWSLSIATLVFASAPYRWLGLQGLRRTVTFFGEPKALHDPGPPLEQPLLVAALLAGAALVIAWTWTRSGRPRLFLRALPGLVVVAAVVLQTAAHTSTRSPYTLIPHLESRAKPWYRLNLFPDGKGAVNADAPYFTSLDDHFKGIPAPVKPLLLRRSFPHWIGSHATYFANPYYVYLLLNMALWVAATLATYGWVYRVTGVDRVARLAAGLSLSLTGFIVFVAQPMSYFAGLASVPIVLWAFEALLVEEPRARAMFGAVLGLAAASYDLWPLVPLLGLYGRLRGVPWRPMCVSLLFTAAVSGGWPILQHAILVIPSGSNLAFATGALASAWGLVRRNQIGVLMERSFHALGVWLTSLLWAFSGVTTLLGAAGLAWAPKGVRVLIGVLLVPSLLVVALFVVGNARWGQVGFGELPRLVTLSWPAVILAAAIALDRCGTFCTTRGRPGLGRALPWAFTGMIAILHNADAFGFVRLVYHFYWPTALGCDPYGAAACSEL